MIKMICDKCNKDADFFSAEELTKDEIDKLSIVYNTEFKSKLIKDTWICSDCGDTKDFIHVLY